MAPFVELVGDVQKAQERGWLGFGGGVPDRILASIPKSRGGLLEGPDADADWERRVAEVLERDGMTLEELRQQMAAAEGDDSAEV